MLRIENISKQYVTGDLVQNALNNVSFNLRDNEFVAILGPSGSGKTTLLNIIGGLDRYDSGDLIINGISTKKYKDRDWDSYRNHTIGFVFQSYNLIPHQSVLSNVELALTISGISKSERRKRAIEALEKVGLGNQIKKRPNQMSGGQMQRVAIARALVNDPDILLADEPTGALDSETSVQVMELLKQVAKDRLVVMVTHNGDLAEQYATRTIRLKDGVITDDTAPYTVDESALEPPKHKNMGHSSMSFFTALSLSFNNLRTKKGRTILTAFAGSIGIIGIALILSLSTGVNNYINKIQKETMLSYPITITETTIDLSSLISTNRETEDYGELTHALDAVYTNSVMMEMASTMTTSITENNLTEFKKYIEDPENEINEYIGETGVVYSYSTDFDIYTHDGNGDLVNTDGSTLTGMKNPMAQSGAASMFGSAMSIFEEMIPGRETLVSNAVTDSYDVVYGSWPQNWDEIVIVLSRRNEIPSTMLYQLGFLPTADYRQILSKLMAGEEPDVPNAVFSYEEACEKEYTLLPACSRYVDNGNGTFSFVGENEDRFADLMDNGIRLKICGIIRPREDADAANITGTLAYTKALTDRIIEMTDESEVVSAQKKTPAVNVVSGLDFTPADDSAKVRDAKKYLEGLNISEKAAVCSDMMKMMYAGNEQMTAAFEQMGEAELAASLDQYLASEPNEEMLISLYDTYISSGTFEENMDRFGVISKDAPSSIAIYVDSFEDKDSVNECIRVYNETADQENKITYTDYIGLLMSSITTIIDTISYVLIAFVSVSLVVSSIMIGIITFISVLERTKEIGILRAIGASKRNVSQVFNAETFIIGLFSGLMGIGITELLLIPANMIIHAISGNPDVNATLPLNGAIILVVLSMALTLIAGLIPSRKAAKKDPVTALRTE